MGNYSIIIVHDTHVEFSLYSVIHFQCYLSACLYEAYIIFRMMIRSFHSWMLLMLLFWKHTEIMFIRFDSFLNIRPEYSHVIWITLL